MSMSKKTRQLKSIGILMRIPYDTIENIQFYSYENTIYNRTILFSF